MDPRVQNAPRLRRAFTVVETVIAAGASLIILLAVASAFVTAQRMLHTTMSDSERSLSDRAARERAPMFTARHALY